MTETSLRKNSSIEVELTVRPIKNANLSWEVKTGYEFLRRQRILFSQKDFIMQADHW